MAERRSSIKFKGHSKKSNPITTQNIQGRTIYNLDNLEVLRGTNSGTVDMIYLDPPFNTNKTWAGTMGSESENVVFDDTWGWSKVKEDWIEDIRAEHEELHHFLNGMLMWASEKDAAYIAYMSIRMIECHRVLKDTGTLFYHCDHVMNDYVKVMLDIVFGRGHDINNIVWNYGGPGRGSYFPKKHDNIFMYAKTKNYKFNKIYGDLPDYLFTRARQDEDGRQWVDQNLGNLTEDKIAQMKNEGRAFTTSTGKLRRKQYIDEMKGSQINDVWDIPIINSQSNERTGYPTQKPLALLKRIIECSTDPGDLVLDPFCGCATTCIAAEQLGRNWVGIDVSIKAWELVKLRLKRDVPPDLFRGEPNFSNLSPVRNSDELFEEKDVYIISNAAYKGEFKVGIASNSKARLNSYQTSDPNRGYKLEFNKRTPLFRAVEKAVQDHFDNRHEWIRAGLQDIIDFIEDYGRTAKLNQI